MATTPFHHLLLFLFLLSFSSSSSSSHDDDDHHHHHHHAHITHPKPSTTPASTSSPSPLIDQACVATRFPDTCTTTMFHSQLPTSPSPPDLILATLLSSSSALDTALSNARSLLSSSHANPNLTNAASNCVDLLTYSSHRLHRSFLSLPSSLPDSRAFASAALLYQYDCFSALKYVNTSRQVDHAMLFLLHLTQITSNALSLLLSYHRFSNNTSHWRPPQTERDGFWDDPSPSSSSSSSFPPTTFPSDHTPNATVCQTGSAGCYATVQAAIDAAPSLAAGRYVIHIRAGVYREMVRVPFEKTNVVFLGDGMGKTVITSALHAGVPGVSTFNTATVAAAGDGFAAKGITFENTAGPDAHQAVAFRSTADLSVLEDVEFLGHQDTLYCHSLRQYYRRCRIAGTVDFVFGNSATVFENCTMLVRPRQVNRPEKGETNAVTAQGRTDPAQATGFVLDGCTVDGTEEYLELYRKKPEVHRNYLGRPWKEYSRTVLVNCYLGEIVRPEGWLPWTGDFALSTLFYGEFGSRGPSGDVSRRVSWSSQIPAEHVRVYSVANFIQGGVSMGAHSRGSGS